MTATKEKPAPVVMKPREVAQLLGVGRRDLLAIFRAHRFEFTELAPGGKPGDRGPNRWGVTREQFAAMLKGLAQRPTVPRPEAEESRSPAVPPGGRSLLTRRKKLA